MEGANEKVKVSFTTTRLRREKLRYLSRRDGLTMDELLDHALGWLLRRRGHSIYGRTADTEIDLPEKKKPDPQDTVAREGINQRGNNEPNHDSGHGGDVSQ
jgi:hypothetical protein